MSIVGPAGLPAPIVAAAQWRSTRPSSSPSSSSAWRDVGLAALPMTVEAFGEFIKRDAVRWAELVNLSGAKAE